MIVKNILTDLAVESAQPKSKPLKVANETGSSSETTPATVRIDKDYEIIRRRWAIIDSDPNGGKWWHFRSRFNGKEGKISLGVYPEVSLEEARKSVTNARVNSTRVLIPAHRAKKRVGRVNRSETIHSAS